VVFISTSNKMTG